MKKRDMKTWVSALRSGEYNQIKGSLHDKRGFCCLGVAADVLVEGDWIYSPDNKCYKIDNEGGLLTDDILVQIKLSKNAQEHLACLNDDGESFEYIADFIERNFDHLNDPGYEF